MSSDQQHRQQNSSRIYRRSNLYDPNHTNSNATSSSMSNNTNRRNANNNGRGQERDAPGTSRPMVRSVQVVQPPSDDGWGEPDPTYWEKKERKEEARRSWVATGTVVVAVFAFVYAISDWLPYSLMFPIFSALLIVIRVVLDGPVPVKQREFCLALTGLKSLVNSTQERIKSEQMRDEEKDHLKAVAEGLERRIKHIVDICGQMRTTRLAYLARRKKDFRLSHLVQEKKAKEMRGGGLSPTGSLLALEKMGEQEVRRRKIDTEDWEGFADARDGAQENETVFEEMERRESEERERAERRKCLTQEELEGVSPSEEGAAGDAERVQLMEENERTYERLASVHKEMDGVEMQVAEIQRLQETFAEKLMEQEADIEILHEQAQNTTENLREANDFIREAITNSASRRVVILFCIVVLTFAILWVDWYNP